MAIFRVKLVLISDYTYKLRKSGSDLFIGDAIYFKYLLVCIISFNIFKKVYDKDCAQSTIT